MSQYPLPRYRQLTQLSQHQTRNAMQDIDNASKPDDASRLDNAPHNSDLEVNTIIREIEMELLLQV